MNMYDNHNKIILKHENMLKDMLTIQVYSAKNDTFQKSIDARVQTSLFAFNETMNRIMSK